jgi:Divergent InlB B-repeat domain
MSKSVKLIIIVSGLAIPIFTLQAGSVSYGETQITASDGEVKYSLTVIGGNPSGSYAPGTQVTVTAEPAPSGTNFLGWTGDIQILANPFLPKTVATIPFLAVKVTATYTQAPAICAPSKSSEWEG